MSTCRVTTCGRLRVNFSTSWQESDCSEDLETISSTLKNPGNAYHKREIQQPVATWKTDILVQ